MVINETVKAKVLTGSGDALWDSLTVISLLTWKFSPAIQDGKPIKLTVRRKFIVMYEKPEIISLAEIQLKDNSLADSVYMALVEGANFFELALKYSISISSQKKGFLGSVDIKQYSKDISRIISTLDEEEFTKPLKFGEHYIIFKRLKRNN
jgi:parvulin-like peptidyl-prolyl isomerase